MNTKTVFTAITITFFSITTMQAQEKKHDDSKHEHAEMKMDKPMYACPMHADEKSDKAGKCSKCGMEIKKMEMAKAYMCPMKCEGDKTYAKEGKCPKCGMALKEMKKDKMKMDKMKKKKKDDHSGHKH